MKLRAAILNVKRITLAVVLTDAESTYPEPGNDLLKRAQLIFRTLPIVLLSPRTAGFSRSYATFELDWLIDDLNADEILWQTYSLRPAEEPLPF